MFDLFIKALSKNSFMLIENLYREKKTCNIYTHIFESTFPREDVIDLVGWAGWGLR